MKFYIISLWGRNISLNLTNGRRIGAAYFRKKSAAGAAWEKSREPEPLNNDPASQP